MKFERSDDESDGKYDTTKSTNVKYGDNDGNVQVAKTDVETVNLNGDDAQKGFMYQIDKEDITAKLFDISALPEGTILYYISPE